MGALNPGAQTNAFFADVQFYAAAQAHTFSEFIFLPRFFKFNIIGTEPKMSIIANKTIDELKNWRKSKLVNILLPS